VSNKDVKQDALDNLADALTEDILNTPDDELLREVQEDYGDPRALANKFDQILERAEKQVFGTAHYAASPQVRSSVLDLPISLPDETIRWVNGIGSRLSEFLSSLRPRTLAWSATAAAVVILVQAAVITAVVVEEQGASSGPSLATPGIDILPRATQPPVVFQRPNGSGVGSRSSPFQAAEAPAAAEALAAAAADTFAVPEVTETLTAAAPGTLPPQAAAAPGTRLSDEEIAALVAGGRQLMVAGDIPNARLVLQQAAEADNATAALELGATYDPTFLSRPAEAAPPPGDVRIARLWYEKAKDLGSTEAAVRLEKLRSVPDPRPGAMSDD
jgi:hypothetical protein